RHVPGVEDRALGGRKDDAPQRRGAVWIAPRLVAVEDLAAAHQPVALTTAAAEWPAPADHQPAVDGHGAAAAGPNRSAEDHVGTTAEQLANAVVGETERCRAGNRVRGKVPADGAGRLHLV